MKSVFMVLHENFDLVSKLCPLWLPQLTTTSQVTGKLRELDGPTRYVLEMRAYLKSMFQEKRFISTIMNLLQKLKRVFRGS